MLKNQFIKTAGLIVPFLLLFMGCQKDPIVQEPTKTDLTTFEKQYSDLLGYNSNNTIRLIGYKKIKLSPNELGEFLFLMSTNKNKFHNYYYNEADKTVRIYFPVEAALVEDNTALAEASAMGELRLNNSQIDGDDPLFVVGRKQTNLVTGVEGNIIKDGIIYLAQKNKSDHRIGNVFVFDFGYKMLMDHDHSGKAMEKAACMTNHGGWRNCSNAFGIFKGRCPFNANVCMDYNGWFTNCVNGKWSNFPGSDCDYALGAGHCWNEVM
jgi:hypothetical protein